MAIAAVAHAPDSIPSRAEPRLAPVGEAAITCRNVSVRFFTDRRSVTALSGIDLDVTRGEFLTLLGPSGCGKSTLLRAVADLVTPNTGEVRVLGSSAEAARRRRDIGFVFQDPALLPWRTALQNVSLPLEVADGAKHKGKATPSELLELVGLKGWERSYPHELSGGMRQRVSIARALVSDPKVLLMDEPFGALDEITRDRLNEELRRVWREIGTTILFVTHSIYEAAYLGQRVLMLSANPGRVKEVVPVRLPENRTLDIRAGIRRTGGVPAPRSGGLLMSTPNVLAAGPAAAMAGLDGLKVEDLTRAEMQGRKHIGALLDYVRGQMPGFERCYLVDVAPQTGVRQTRLLDGEYVINKEDLAQRTPFADTVARGRDYTTPYRTLLPKNVENLLVAGRHYSATPAAQKISREIPPCMAMGEAAGMAAAMALDSGVRVRDIDVQLLQRKLRAQGADPGDQPDPNPDVPSIARHDHSPELIA